MLLFRRVPNLTTGPTRAMRPGPANGGAPAPPPHGTLAPGAHKDNDKGKPQEKKRLEELTEGEREKKQKRVLKLERQAKNIKDSLAGQTPGEA